MAASPARSNAAAIRQSKLVGVEGTGPSGCFGGRGGSRTPIPLNLRGGPLERAGDACGSSSGSNSAKSCGMKLNFTPMSAKRLEEAEDGFDGDPRGDGAAGSVLRRYEFPSADRLSGALIETQPDSLDNPNLRSATVGAN